MAGERVALVRVALALASLTDAIVELRAHPTIAALAALTTVALEVLRTGAHLHRVDDSRRRIAAAIAVTPVFHSGGLKAKAVDARLELVLMVFGAHQHRADVGEHTHEIGAIHSPTTTRLIPRLAGLQRDGDAGNIGNLVALFKLDETSNKLRIILK